MRLTIVRHELTSSWRGPVIAVVSISLLTVLAMEMYSHLDLSIYDSLPEALRRIMNLPTGASATVFAYNEMLGIIGALTLAGILISLGSRAVAGEEQCKTASFVLSTPVSRHWFALFKAVTMILICAVAGAVVWGAAELSAIIVGAQTGESHLLALCVHLSANALLHGCIAFGIGAASGRGGLGAGISASLMLSGMIFAGLLPAWDSARDLAKAIPWHWFSGHTPLVNGIHGGYLALQLGFSAAFALAGVIGFARRDLRFGPPTSQFTQRLHTLSTLRRAAFLPRGLFSLLISLRLGLTVTIAIFMTALMGVAMGALYPSMRVQLAMFATNMPRDMLAIMGVNDLSTPEGFMWSETMGLIAPIAVIIVGVSATNDLAKAERDRLLSPILGSGVSRTRLLASTAVTLTTQIAIVTLATGVGLWGASLAGDLQLSITRIGGSCLLLFGLGMAYSAIGLLAAAATGSPTITAWSAAGAAVVGHFANAYLRLSDEWTPWKKLSLHHYYTADEPLVNALNWGRFGVLVAVSALLCAISFLLFARRNLR